VRTNVSIRRRRAIGAAIAAAAVCLAIAACGSSPPSGTEADPSGLAPASSAIYLSAVVHPEGALRQSTIADLRTLTHAGAPLTQLLQAVAGSTPLAVVNFKREVEPWVGTNAGVFATSADALTGAAEAIGGAASGGISPEALLHAAGAGLLAHGTPAALVLDTRDLAEARSFLKMLAARQHAQHASYRGIAYDATTQGAAEAIVGKFAVFGDQAGVREAIDTYLGGPSLKGASSAYETLAAKGPAGELAGVYLNPGTGQTSRLLQALPGQPRQARISIVPQHGSIQLDFDLLAANAQAEAQAVSSASAATSLIAGLPGSSWLAAGIGESGPHAAGYLTLLNTVVDLAAKSVLAHLGGPALQELLAKLQGHAQAVQRLVSPWAGPAAVFAAGSGLLSIQAGLVIQSSSTAAARSAVAEIGALLSGAGAKVNGTAVPGAESAARISVAGLPVSLYIGAASGKLVIGLGPESIQGVLSPTSELSSSSLYSSASSTLGGAKPSIIVDFPMALALLEGLGLQENQQVGQVLQQLRSLGTLTGAVQSLGNGVLRLRAIADLQS
jgi:hypothetical protein